MVIKHIDFWNNIFVNFHRTENLKEDEKTRKKCNVFDWKARNNKNVENKSITTRNF